MARRIVVAMLVLVGALLITTVVPLGLLTTSRERDSFSRDTILSARALAAVAEETISDHGHGPALTAALARTRRAGEAAWVYDGSGRLIAATGAGTGSTGAGTGSTGGGTGSAGGGTGNPGAGTGPPVPQDVLATAIAGGGTVHWDTEDSLWVVVGLRDMFGRGSSGAVVFSRSSSDLEDRLKVLWAWLVAVAAAGLAAAAVVAAGFARWVARPLSELDTAAARLGAGELDTRIAAGHGPPEARRLAGTFNTMAGRLQALVHDHRAMMADVSHQLRTPLAALRLRLDLLAQDADSDTTAELSGAQDEIARLSRLVDGLLAVARAENTVAEPVPVAVDAAVRDRAAAWRPVAEERGVTLATHCPAPLTGWAGEGHLEQVLDNLLANALDAVPAGGHVTVSAVAAGWGARVTVADDGPGMTPEQQRAAFRRFASTTHAGAGLGLAIVHRLVTVNGGTASLSDTPGGGLTVTLELRGTS
jgi:signal transduction histidine kinase